MPRLTIDSREVQVPDGATVLDAARALGIEIPTLCFLEGRRPSTSCMVCLVKINGSPTLAPSCGTVAAEGMVVESETPEVHEARRTALELLLGEHLGDCHAPCRLAHPTLLDIPRLIRHVAAGEFAEAAALAAGHPDAGGDDTKAPPYERACRRGRKDQPVAIERLVRFARQQARFSSGAPPESEEALTPALSQGERGPEGPRDAAKPPRPFSVHIGRLSDEEMAEYSRLASDAPRTVPADGHAFTPDEARAEAARCLHCDCRRLADCRLKQWAERYGANPRRFRGTPRVFRQHLGPTGLIYEPGKCILCGLCVQIAEAAREPLGLAFVGRGFDVRVGVPFNDALADALTRVAADCAAACPTGALAFADQSEA